MLRTQDDAERDLGHLDAMFFLIVRGAWDNYEERHRVLRGDYTNARVQATLLHQYMENRARALLVDVPGITMPPPGSQLFYIDWHLTYRIKPRMLHWPGYAVATNMTRLGLAFVDQSDDLQMTLGLVEPITNLHLGYLLNAAHSGMASAHLVCPDGPEDYHWQRTLQPPEEAAAPVRLPQPEPGPRVKPKETEPPADDERQDGAAS